VKVKEETAIARSKIVKHVAKKAETLLIREAMLCIESVFENWYKLNSSVECNAGHVDLHYLVVGREEIGRKKRTGDGTFFMFFPVDRAARHMAMLKTLWTRQQTSSRRVRRTLNG
jgi:hypothetical protein